jgi:hypothetical protein
MIDLVVGSTLVTLLAVVLSVCLKTLSATVGALVWRNRRPVSLNPHATRSHVRPIAPRPTENNGRSRSNIRRSGSKRVFPVLAALAFGFGMPLALPGCGGGDGQAVMIKPAAAPAVSAKDSMDNYLQSHVQSKAKAAKRSYR